MVKLKLDINNLIDPLNDVSPFSSTPLNIMGDIVISYGDLILTKCDDKSPDSLKDAVVYILLELHQIISRLFYTSISWRVSGRIGVRFIFNRYALLFYGGEASINPIITVMVYDSRRQNATPFEKIRVTPEEIARAVQSATKLVLENLLILENEVINTTLIDIRDDYLKAGDEMKRSAIYKELAFSYLKTTMIMKEHKEIKESKMERPVFFNYMGGFARQDLSEYEW